jgi:hypothetical protein
MQHMSPPEMGGLYRAVLFRLDGRQIDHYFSAAPDVTIDLLEAESQNCEAIDLYAPGGELVVIWR